MAAEFEPVRTGRSGDHIMIQPGGTAYLPEPTYRRLFGECAYIQYHVDPDRELLALEPVSDDGVIPDGAHSVQETRQVRCQSVVESIGKILPTSPYQASLELDDGLPYIDVSGLPDASDYQPSQDAVGDVGGESA